MWGLSEGLTAGEKESVQRKTKAKTQEMKLQDFTINFTQKGLLESGLGRKLKQKSSV